MTLKNRNVYLKIIELALPQANGFTGAQLIGEHVPDMDFWKTWEINIIDRYLTNADTNYKQNKILGKSGNAETMFIVIDTNEFGKNIYTLSYDAHFKYIDYQELKLARKNATQARMFSFIAIGVAVLSIVISLLFTQKVRIEQAQINEIKHTIIKY